MARSPIGHSVGRLRPQMLRPATGAGLLGSILPSSQWTGIQGSGFASIPSDPARTTAKPACRLVTVPGQRFTSSHVVGVMAFANDGGTLIGGIDRVRFHFEGATRDVLDMTPRTIVRDDGTSYQCWAYWVALRKPDGRRGHAHLYVEVIPADATMQRRVIGPFLYSPEDTTYSHELVVAPSLPAQTGARYQSIGAALDYLRSQTSQSARITISEAGTYDINEVVAPWAVANWLTITATAPVTIGKPGFVDDVTNQLRPKVNRLHFEGRNITFDMRYISQIKLETEPYWFDRCRFTNSIGTRYALWRAGLRPFASLVFGAPYFTECDFEYCDNVCNLALIARGNKVVKGAGDFTGDAQCVIYNRVDDYDSTVGDNGSLAWLMDVDALSVTYTGAEATANLALNGNSDASTRTFTATWGANTATFDVGATEQRFNTANAIGYNAATVGQGYFFHNVATWLNSLPGWSATVLNNTRRASSASLPGLKGAGFAVLSVKNTPRTVVSCFDQHADFYQQRWDSGSANPTQENVIIAFNITTNFRGQQIYLGPLYGEPTKDYAVVSNAMHNKTGTSQYADFTGTASSFRGPHSHVMTVHNSWVSQGLTLRATETVQSPEYQNSLYNPDSYNLIANNVTRQLQWYLGVTLNVGFISGNHSQQTGNLAGSNTSTGGDFDSLFANAATGNFSPQGALLTNGRTTVFAIDALGKLRKNIDVPGAIGSDGKTVAAYVAAPPPPPQTEWDFSQFIPQTIGTGAMAEIVSATVGRATRISGSAAGGLAIALQPGQYRLRASLTDWPGNGAAHLALSRGPLTGPVAITADAGTATYFANGPVDCTFTIAAATQLLLRSTSNLRSFTLTKGANPLLVKIA